jgi:hypothetical protein
MTGMLAKEGRQEHPLYSWPLFEWDEDGVQTADEVPIRMLMAQSRQKNQN